MGPMKPKGLRICALGLLICSSPGAGHGGQGAVTETKDAEFLGLAKSWAEGVSANDADRLSDVLDADYEHIHGTGLQESRGQFLEALRSGARKYEPIRLEELRVKPFGDFALVTGKFSLRVEVRGKVIEGVNRFCMTMMARPSGWKVVQFQATALPAKP